MKIAVVCDAHIFETSTGEFWCTSVYGYSFFKRFMNVYDQVRIVARVKKREMPEDGKFLRVDGPRVEVFPVYFFQGPKELAANFTRIYSSLKGFYDSCDVILYRMPSTTAQLAYIKARKQEKPKGIEVVYNVHDELTDNILSLPRKAISYINDRFLSKACKSPRVNGVSYVTKNTLQQFYPSYARLNGSDSTHFEEYYSTLQYKPEFLGAAKNFNNHDEWKLINVVIHIQNKTRGHETMIKALKVLLDSGYNVTMEFIGDGPLVVEFKDLARKLGVSEKIIWTGLLPSSSDVNQHFKNADIFVYPTHFAGLPRVLIEAMGSGLPCVCTPVAGIPEMIDRNNLFPVDDANALAEKLIFLFNHPDLLETQSRSNIESAKEFTDDILQTRRDDFYRKLSGCCEE